MTNFLGKDSEIHILFLVDKSLTPGLIFGETPNDLDRHISRPNALIFYPS
jgi:hypothetical protein